MCSETIALRESRKKVVVPLFFFLAWVNAMHGVISSAVIMCVCVNIWVNGNWMIYLLALNDPQPCYANGTTEIQRWCMEFARSTCSNGQSQRKQKHYTFRNHNNDADTDAAIHTKSHRKRLSWAPLTHVHNQLNRTQWILNWTTRTDKMSQFM